MADQESRLQDALLPIGSNPIGQDQQASNARFRTQNIPQQQYGTAPGEDSWAKTKKCCWWTTVILAVFLVFLIISLKLFFFRPISKGPPTLDNSTATEPNTKTHFRLLVDGPRNRVQSLVGASAWIYRIPIPTHPQLALAAVGLYVERAEGKRRLRKFQGEEITDDNFEDVKAVLVKGGMTETLRYVLATTPPSGRMLEMFEDNSKPILEKVCPDKVDQELKAFADFFPDPFQKGDDFTFERREGEDLYGFRKDGRSHAVRVAGSCMARALFEGQFTAQKSSLVNLLEGFFER